jgi:hypothetical protein
MTDKTISSTWGGPIKLVDLGDETYAIAVDVRNADEIGGSGAVSLLDDAEGNPVNSSNPLPVSDAALDIALSALRDAIVKTGATSKTLADVVDAIEGMSILVRVSANFTRPSNATPYAIGDAVTNSTSAPTVFQLDLGAQGAANGQPIEIRSLQVVSSVKGTTLPLLSVFLSNITFTASNDNAVLDIADATVQAGGQWISCIEQNYSNSNSEAAAKNISIPMKLAAADNKLYGTIRADNAYTPASGEVFYIIAYIELR